MRLSNGRGPRFSTPTLKTSVGRAIAFGCTTRCNLSVHNLAMPRSGLGHAFRCGGEIVSQDIDI